MQILFANKIKKKPRGLVGAKAGCFKLVWRPALIFGLPQGLQFTTKVNIRLINRASNLFCLLPEHPVEKRETTGCTAAQAKQRFAVLVDELRQLLA